MLSDTVCSLCPVLKTQPLCGLSKASRAQLERWVAPLRLGHRAFLFKTGQWPTFVYALREGSLKLIRGEGGDGGTVVEIVFPGEWVGVNALLAGEAYTVSAEALEPSALCAVRQEEFLERFAADAEFSREVVHQLSDRLGQAQTLLLMRSQHDAASQLASCLLYLDGRQPAGSAPGVALTKSDLGQIIATAQETVFRLLAKFEKQGLLERHERRIVLKDKDGLRAVAANPKNTGSRGRRPGPYWANLKS